MNTARPPFDALDLARAESYLRGKGRTAIDPHTEPRAKHDVIYTTSLSGARLFIAERFGMARSDGTPFRGYPVIVGKPTVNAFAVDHDGLQICGMDAGLGSAAFGISLFVFSQGTLFQEIGNAAGERSPGLPPGSDLAFWFSDRLRQRSSGDKAPIGLELIPRDTQRQRAAQFLTQLLLRFVWLHELYHCLCGHTGFMAAQYPGAVLNEMPGERRLRRLEVESFEDFQRHASLRQAMEYDADRAAFWMLIQMQQIDFEPIAGAASLPRLLRLKLAIFAGAMMTFVFDQAARRQINQKNPTHPTGQYRLINLIRTLVAHFDAPPSPVKPAFHAALDEMASLQRHLPQFATAARLIEGIHSKQLQGDLDKIDHDLKTAQVIFDPFAFKIAVSSIAR